MCAHPHPHMHTYVRAHTHTHYSHNCIHDKNTCITQKHIPTHLINIYLHTHTHIHTHTSTHAHKHVCVCAPTQILLMRKNKWTDSNVYKIHHQMRKLPWWPVAWCLLWEQDIPGFLTSRDLNICAWLWLKNWFSRGYLAKCLAFKAQLLVPGNKPAQGKVL